MYLSKYLRIRIKIKELLKLLVITFNEWNDKDPFRQSAVIAYYAIFSMPGLLLLIFSITGYFFGKEVVSQNMLTQISETMGEETALQIMDMLTKAGASKSNIIGSIIGVITILAGATGVFVELQKTLNIIWKVKAIPTNGILLFFKSRLFSFGLILAIAFLLLVSLVVSAGLAAMSNWIRTDASELMIVVFSGFNFVFSFFVITTLFALMFKLLPDAKILWKHVWLGAIITGLLFELGKNALAFYFGKVEPASVYGAAGSVILILIWVSYSSMILFFGAEFTAAYARMFSGTVAPTSIARKDMNQQV